MLIRATTDADLDRVVALEAALDTWEWLGETGRAWHARALSDPDQEHLMADVDGTPAGLVVLAG